MSRDPRKHYDALRSLPPARDERGRWVIARHADVVAVAADPVTFSSAVSRFLQVPNGLDGEAHRAARALLDPFFAADRMEAFEPAIRSVADDLVAELVDKQMFDAVGGLGATFAVRGQSVWLGWPAHLESELLDWMEDNHAASRSGDLARTAAVAAHFDAIVRSVLDVRRAAGAAAPNDLTTELVRLVDANGQPLRDEVLVSILRNWTGGDLGSIALCAGVVLHGLAEQPDLQRHLRSASDAELLAAIDEFLRLDDPFVSNRRVATRAAEVGGHPVAAGEQLVLNWTAANRDPDAFDGAESFDPQSHAAANLVYGTGPHICPGRPLASLELLVLTRALLDAGQVSLAPDSEPEREQPPVGGFRHLPVVLHRRFA